MIRQNSKCFFLAIWVIGILTSCNTLEKSSMHGFNSGYYKMKSENEQTQNVYLDVNEEKIDVYTGIKNQPENKQQLSISIDNTDSLIIQPVLFKKQSLDIDVTSVLLKYRPSVSGLPAQLNTDLNMALYVGWRHDYYFVTRRKDPLNRNYTKINTRGYDIGFFTGPGTTMISPFTTRNQRSDEYSGMILQAGFAGFFESHIASFGIAVGYDYLLNSDRNIWIYHHKPWIGFIVGIALN